MAKQIVLIATLDTKELEADYIRGLIERSGHIPVVVDCGVMKDPTFEPAVSRHAVAKAANTTIVKDSCPSGYAITVAVVGVFIVQNS